MQLTSAGTILLTIVGLITFALTFRSFIKDESLDDESGLFKTSLAITILFFSAVATTIITVLVYFIITSSHQTADNFHTIYSNRQNAKVVFKANLDDVEFVGGQPIKKNFFGINGTLTLSKDGVEVKKNVYFVYYLGDKEPGSIVEKIEYSNSVWENKIFGIVLARSEDHHALKIHLKKTSEKTAKEEKDAKIKKELNSILESSK